MITNSETNTRADEVGPRIFRISTPVPPSVMPGGFTFNQFLLAGEEPLLFHTGPRHLFPVVSEAIAKILPLESLRWIALSHVEADECGALNLLLAAAPSAQPLCGMIAAMVSIEDLADRAPRGLADGETVELGQHRVRWLDAPHLPHGWDCGYLFEEGSRTLLCGDLFTQPGHDGPALTTDDILGPSEAFRNAMDYYSHTKNAPALIEKLASLEPRTLACMHGSSFSGDGASKLRELGRALDV